MSHSQLESGSRISVSAPAARGAEDVSGRGLLGLTFGIVAGFGVAFYWLVPLFPRVRTTENLTAMTIVVVIAMTLGGAIGYLATRRRAAVSRAA